ncbi:MAG: MMPL family transporter, partial [Thermoplasmata archaeon]|nr:MMPL family transporter [Thermoplasmata archaeon]
MIIMRRSITGLNFFEGIAKRFSKGKSRESGDLLNQFGDAISRAPKTTFAIIMALTIFFYAASSGSLPHQDGSMSDNISTNIDQYIPEGTEEKRILDIVRENWATKVVIILVKTGNYYDKNCKVNITDRDVLEEISSVEGDDIYPGSNFARGDSGEEDWIEYILSLPCLIKEINSSSPRMANVLEEEMATELEEMFGYHVNVSDDDETINDQGKYAIPQNQSQVDQIIAQIPHDVLKGFCADTNGDGTWDITYSMMGCLEDTPDEEERDFIDEVIKYRRTAKSGDEIDPYFDDGTHHTWIMQTGLIAIMIDITDECNEQLLEVMPLAAGLVALVMLVAHRSWKVFLIAGIPLGCTIFWTFGIITLTNVELSALILAAMPMLIGLSVDYSLHISNRITEFEEEGYTIREGIGKTFHTTGIAVLLSAVTTIIGFSALLMAPLAPIRTLGLMLVIGIASAFILSITIVPCIILMFHYKKPELKVWEKIAEVPIRHKWHIIIVVLIVTMISLANLAAMTETEEERNEDPETAGIESLDAIIEFGDIWSKGSMSLLVIEPNKEAKKGTYRDGGALNDTEFLDQICWLEENITTIERDVDVEDVSAMT